MKIVLSLIFLALFCHVANGLRCQVCMAGKYGTCKNKEDIGESMECNDGETCLWQKGPYPEQNFGFPIEYFRRCDNSKMKNIMGCNQSMINDDAIKVDGPFNYYIDYCRCNSNNCNKWIPEEIPYDPRWL